MEIDPRYRDFYEKNPALGLIGNTPLVRVDIFEREHPGLEVLAKCEWTNPGASIKDRPVLRMLLEAALSGELEGKTILDSTSGNAGIAYAMIGTMLGYPVELVIPGNASQERKQRIRAHGAGMVFTDPIEGYDEALRTCRRRYEENPEKYFFADQYANENNWKSHYETTAVEILAQTGGKLTHFVAGVGTGGTITGVGRRLKEHDPKIRVVYVIPEAFPGIEGLKPLQSPEDIRPEILDESVIDEKIEVTVDDAYEFCNRLARRGVFAGQSSGAYLKGVLELARRGEKGTCVTVFSDAGERYFSTGLWGDAAAAASRVVT